MIITNRWLVLGAALMILGVLFNSLLVVVIGLIILLWRR